MLRPIFCFLLAFWLSACAPSQDRGPIVLAASSLQQPLEELADHWAAQGHDRPVFSFASSAALARQIESGSAADLYISADHTWTGYLITQGRIDDAGIRTIARNQLVLAANADARIADRLGPGSTLGDALQAGRIVVGNPDTVPLGRYTRDALDRQGLWQGIEGSVIPAASAQQAVRLVSRGETPLGIIYLSDTAANQHVETLHRIETAEPIEYLALRLPASAHPDTSSFLDLLTSDRAAAIFQKHGFTVP